MAGSTRINGTKLMLKLGATDHWADITSYELSNEEADNDVTTFADAAAGGSRQFKLSGEAIQSTDTTSFWSYVWANTGQTVGFLLSPHGNSSGTANQPVFTGNVKIGPKPTIGGEAGNTFTFEFEWDVQGEPVKNPA